MVSKPKTILENFTLFTS